MPTAKGGYFSKSRPGLRVPGTTTVISRFKEAGGLMHWSWDLGMKGIDYRTVRDQAADAGTLAHAAVEAWVRRRPFTPPQWADAIEAHGPEVVERAEKAYGAFLEWARQTQLTVTETEVALVSETHLYGGTLDAVLVSGKRAIGDWKTAKALYPDMLLQIAAYGRLWDETHPDDPITGGYHLLRFDKEYGDFHAHWWGELETAWQAFLHLRALYELEKELKARVK